MGPEILKQSEGWLPQLIELGQSILLCIVILVIGWIVASWARRLTGAAMQKRGVDEALTKFLSMAVRYTVIAGTVVAALGTVGIETTSLVALLGSAGIAVGLALQGNLSHFASGVMILFFRPFTIGDVITAGGHTGTVQEIGLFATVLHTVENAKVIIPNATITGGAVVNITVLGTRRGTVAVGVEYGADVGKVAEILKGAVDKVDNVLAEPEPAIVFTNLGASSLDFDVRVFATNEHFWGVVESVRKNVYNDLNEAGIDIPYNQIVVHNAE